MWKLKKRIVSAVAATALLFGSSPAMITSAAGKPDKQPIPQGISSNILNHADYFGDLKPDKSVTVDIILKIQHKKQLQHYIKKTVTPGNPHYRKYLNTHAFAAKYAPSPSEINAVTHYLRRFEIQSKVYDNHLVLTAHGTVGEFNRAFHVDLKHAKLNGKNFHATKKPPKAPHKVAKDILAILGLSDYSNFVSHAKRRPVQLESDSPGRPLQLDPSDLIEHYNVQPLYDQGATGAGQTIGIVTLAQFNPSDAYTFWKMEGIHVKPNRIHVMPVDGGSGMAGFIETTLDVEQSGALAPMADINVYVGPNSDTGFVDAFAEAISDNEVQQLSVSWGLSETAIINGIRQQIESPAYAKVFNQLFMEAGAQGISMFSAAGDAGAYDATRYPGTFNLSVDNPADSPYITAAGGTTLPFHFKSKTTGTRVAVNNERAWGWDYLYPYFDELNALYKKTGEKKYKVPLSAYFSGGGGGFSTLFDTPDYQKGVSGVNSFTAIKYWKPSSDFTTVTRLDEPKAVTGTGDGRNVPDLAMNADPYTGYTVVVTQNGKTVAGTIGGTSIVAPQLAGLTALINSAYQTQVGFWNPQIYRFAQQPNSPFDPLNTTGGSNDNLFYTGTKGTIYNQATGLGVPDVAALAKHFAIAANHPGHGPKPGHGHPGNPGHGKGHHPGKPGHGHGHHGKH